MIKGYYGEELSDSMCELLAHERIALSLLKREEKLSKTRWFDYRHLHPTKATYLYAWHFVNEVRKLYCRTRDRNGGMFFLPVAVTVSDADKERYDLFRKSISKRRAEVKAGSKARLGYEDLDDPDRRAWQKDDAEFKDSVNNVLIGKDASTLWKGRQMADEIGMPYSLFVSIAIEYIVRGYRFESTNEFVHMPKPKSLYSKVIKDYVMEEWREISSELITTPDLSHMVNHPSYDSVKRDAEMWLCEIISRRARPEYALSTYVFERQFISEQLALEYFGEGVLSEASRVSRFT